jgi:riboflavin synthase
LFTGIVEEVGKISSIKKLKSGEYILSIKCKKISPSTLSIGDSVAVNGACLTVTKKNKSSFQTLASRETLQKTNLKEEKTKSFVNLERAMKANSRFDGHIVSGHIDSTGTIRKIEESGKSIRYWFYVKKKFRKYIIEKGSISINGISLTINDIKGDLFSVNIIPHTSSKTNSMNWKKDDLVNIEFDIIAKYIESLIAR